MGEEREILSYRRRDEQPDKWPTNRWVVGAFLATVILLPPTMLFAGIEIGGMLAAACAAAAGVGMARSKNSNDRILTALTLMMCAFAPTLRVALDQAGSSSVSIECASNLRTIGHGCAFVEKDGIAQYGLDEVWQSLGGSALRCPMHPDKGGTYVLLPNLQPYGKLADRASVVVAYCLEIHPTQKGGGGKRVMTLLYGDGHVETHDVSSAQKLISQSLGAATRPARK